MFNVEHSAFLHSLGYAIGHSLWQMSLLWLVYMAVINTRRWNSTQRYNLAVTASGTGFAWFIGTVIYYSAKTSTGYLPESEILLLKKSVISTENSLFFVYHSVMATLRSLSPYFSCAYLLVMMMLSIRLINGFNEVKQFRTRGLSKSPVKWRLFVNDHAALLGIRKKVVVYISSIATSPLTIGFIKPIILLPVASINNLTPAQLEAVLLHELAHIRRNDYLVNILLQVAEITLFFNPFMRLLLKQARIERENCCDDYVLQFRYNVADYAKALLTIQQQSAGNILALGASNNNEFQLLDRVKRMVSPQRKSFNYRQQLGMLFLLTLLGLGFTIISPREKSDKTEKAKKEVAEVKHPETSIYEVPAIPFDLVKKIEAFGEKTALAVVAKKEKKHAVLHEHEKNITIHEPVIPTAVLPETGDDGMVISDNGTMNFGDANVIALNSKEWGDVVKSGMLKDLSPVFKGVTGLIAPGIEFREKDLQGIMHSPELEGLHIKVKGVKPNKAELAEIEKKVRIEQRKLQSFTRMQSRMQDSLGVVFKKTEQEANLLEKQMARTAKEIAIAPFRVWENNDKETPGAPVFNFNYSNNNFFEENPGTPAPIPGTRIAIRGAVKKKTCNESEPSQVTVMVINGPQLAQKVKKVWAEAQAGNKDGWTADMQQKVVDEIEKELEGIRNIEIRTRTAPHAENDTHSFVIEVKGMP